MSNESNTKLSRLSKYDVILMVENTTEDNVRDTEHTLPTDVHLVTYLDGDDIKYDAVRAHKMADIFDGYFDMGVTVTSIVSGYGKIKPKLYNPEKKEDKKK